MEVSKGIGDIRQEILSVFLDEEAADDIDEAVSHFNKHKKRKKGVGSRFISASVARLACMSSSSGKENMTSLRRYLIDRRSSPSELANVIFGVEDAELMPPLCALVDLLRSDMLRCKDVNKHLTVLRSVYEMSSPDICLCRGSDNGIKAFLQYVMDEGDVHSPDSPIHAFVSILSLKVSQRLGSSHVTSRLLLAEVTLSYIVDALGAKYETNTVLERWTKQASLPLTFALEDSASAPDMPWTPELAGLATGRKASQYFSEGDVQESVLRMLFSAIGSRAASDIYMECINTLLRDSPNEVSRNRASGSWARLVLLGERIANKTSFPDVEEELVRKTISSLSGTLSSVTVKGDSGKACALICLIRRLLIPKAGFNEGQRKNESYPDYKDWFRDYVIRQGRQVVGRLANSLIDLVALEPLSILKLHHRILSLRRDLSGLLSSYLLASRTRISELDPAHHSFLSEKEAAEERTANPGDTTTSRLWETAARFIAEFAKTKKIPSALLRRMNFDRYNFQKTIKIVLLDPSLATHVSDTNDAYFMPWKKNFEAHQISLIQELAFKRKDRGVTTTEANVAIRELREGRKPRLCNGSEEITEKSSLHSLKASDTIEDILLVALRGDVHCDSGRTECSRKLDTNQDAISKLLRTKVKQLVSGVPHVELARVANEILQSFCSALAQLLSKHHMFGVRKRVKGETHIFNIYEQWWNSTGLVLRDLILFLFSDCDIQALQKPFQYQLFALICARTDVLSPSLMKGTAVLAVTIMTLHLDPSLTDLCLVSFEAASRETHILTLILECLPLTNRTRVRNSTLFVIYSVLLLQSASESALETFRYCGGQENVAETEPSTSKIRKACKAQLCSMIHFLRWVLCNPWRLLEDRIRREKAALSSEIDEFEVSTILKQASHALLILGHDSPREIDIKYYLCTELRCRWGYEDAVHGFFERLARTGMKASSIFDDVMCFFGAADNDYLEPHEWIRNAIIRFARDRPLCAMSANDEAETGNQAFESYCREIDNTETRRSTRMFDLFIAVDQCLFHRLTVVDAVRRMKCKLVPRFWPFPARYIRFMVQKLRMGCVNKNPDHGIANFHLLTANITLETVNDIRAGVTGGLSLCFWKGLSDFRFAQEITNVTQAFQILDRSDEVSEGLNGTDKEGLTSLLEKNSLCLGTVIILSLRNQHETNLDICNVRLKHYLHALSAAVPRYVACEVLDSALSTAAIIPFCVRLPDSTNHREDLKLTEEWMKVLMTERLTHIVSGHNLPFCTRKVVKHSAALEDSTIQTCLQWVGRDHTENLDDYLPHSLPVAVCIGRVLGIFRLMTEDSLRRLFGALGKDTVANALVSNAINAYRSLSPQCEYREEKLPAESIQRLLTSRYDIQRNLLDSVASTLLVMQSIVKGCFEDYVANIIQTCQDVADEVRSVLLLRGVLKQT